MQLPRLFPLIPCLRDDLLWQDQGRYCHIVLMYEVVAKRQSAFHVLVDGGPYAEAEREDTRQHNLEGSTAEGLGAPPRCFWLSTWV